MLSVRSNTERFPIFPAGVSLADAIGPALLTGLFYLKLFIRDYKPPTVGEDEVVTRLFCKTGFESAFSYLGVCIRLLIKPVAESFGGDILDL